MKMRMKESKSVNRICVAIFLALMLFTTGASGASAATEQAEVRALVQRIFEQLKAGNYDELYDVLPSASQQRISREKFTNALKRSRDFVEPERIEVGMVRVSGDLALVDTVMYGRLRQPFEGEGKIVAQQYLVRENGSWRVTTGERSTVERFLATNPNFAKQFPVRRARIYVKRDGRWTEFKPPQLRPK